MFYNVSQKKLIKLLFQMSTDNKNKHNCGVVIEIQHIHLVKRIILISIKKNKLLYKEAFYILYLATCFGTLDVNFFICSELFMLSIFIKKNFYFVFFIITQN